MIRDLLDSAIAMVREEMTEAVKEPAEAHVEERLLDYLLPQPNAAASPDDDGSRGAARAAHAREAARAAPGRRAGRPR